MYVLFLSYFFKTSNSSATRKHSPTRLPSLLSILAGSPDFTGLNLPYALGKFTTYGGVHPNINWLYSHKNYRSITNINHSEIGVISTNFAFTNWGYQHLEGIYPARYFRRYPLNGITVKVAIKSPFPMMFPSCPQFHCLF